jgi:hypothetical protein
VRAGANGLPKRPDSQPSRMQRASGRRGRPWDERLTLGLALEPGLWVSRWSPESPIGVSRWKRARRPRSVSAVASVLVGARQRQGSLGNPLGNLRSRFPITATHWEDCAPPLTWENVTGVHHADWYKQTTDQKVGGSNPSERAMRPWRESCLFRGQVLAAATSSTSSS